jgi:hypothetical protein
VPVRLALFRQIDRGETRHSHIARPGGRDQGTDQRGGPAADLGDGGRVPPLDGGLQRAPVFSRNRQRFADCRNERREVQVDGDALDAELGERKGGKQHNLGVRRRLERPDDLAADLPELTLLAQLGASHAKHLAGVAEPHRARLRRQAARGYSGDLQRHVGADAHHPLRHRIHETEGLVGDGGPEAGKEAILEFDERRLHPLVALGRAFGHQPLDQSRLVAGHGRQSIV